MKKRLPLTILLALVSLSVVGAVAPGPPQSLAAVVNDNTVTLNWLPPTTGGVPTGYVVEASLSPSGAPIALLPVPDTTLTVTAVPNGVYYVRVRGVNVDGASESSNEVIVVVPGGGGGCTSPPNAPTNLTSGVSGNVVAVAWVAPTGGCEATAYVVQAGSAPGLSDLAIVNVGAATTLSASAPAGTYYVRVVALNAFGGSAASNEVVLTVGAAPTNRFRIGALCNDGTLSDATGSGACSGHDGVRCWRYNDGTCTLPDVSEPTDLFGKTHRTE
jgi:hypothetical protein